MRDIFGNVLEIGDVVAFNQPGYKLLITGIIMKFTPKGVTISYKDPVNKSRERTTNEYPSLVVKNMSKSI